MKHMQAFCLTGAKLPLLNDRSGELEPNTKVGN